MGWVGAGGVGGGQNSEGVSIPERVWGGLELERDRLEVVPQGTEFQSLRGFGVGWSASKFLHKACMYPFQSLRGFGVGWSLRTVRAGSRGRGFNP